MPSLFIFFLLSFPQKWYLVACPSRWYRPPECLYGARVYDEAVDIWGVGAVFGLSPFLSVSESVPSTLVCCCVKRSVCTARILFRRFLLTAKSRWFTLGELLSGLCLFPGMNDIDQLFRVLSVFGTQVSPLVLCCHGIGVVSTRLVYTALGLSLPHALCSLKKRGPTCQPSPILASSASPSSLPCHSPSSSQTPGACSTLTFCFVWLSAFYDCLPGTPLLTTSTLLKLGRVLVVP
jgi:serine/threonine protein kinase